METVIRLRAKAGARMTEQPKRGGIGTRIRVGSHWNDMTSSAGYASSSLEPVHFGHGSTKTVERVELRWPSGATQVLTDVAINRVVTVTEPEKP
jgi:hypothetical protein